MSGFKRVSYSLVLIYSNVKLRQLNLDVLLSLIISFAAQLVRVQTVRLVVQFPAQMPTDSSAIIFVRLIKQQGDKK